MNSVLKAGIIIVVFALASYSIAVITEQRTGRIRMMVLIFLTLGVLLDITATTLMIIGSSKGPLTLHGIIGYSSLAGMLTDTILVWKLKAKKGTDAEVPKSLHLYARYAYIWWIVAFITGGLLVMIGY